MAESLLLSRITGAWNGNSIDCNAAYCCVASTFGMKVSAVKRRARLCRLCPREFNWNIFHEKASCFRRIKAFTKSNTSEREKFNLHHFLLQRPSPALASWTRTSSKAFMFAVHGKNQRLWVVRRKMQFIIWRLKRSSAPGSQSTYEFVTATEIAERTLSTWSDIFASERCAKARPAAPTSGADQRARTENHIKFEFQSHTFYVTSNF